MKSLLGLAAILAIASTHGITADLNGVTGEPRSKSGIQLSRWQTNGGDWRQRYYSPLTQINVLNVGTLGHAWSYDLDSIHGQEATPVVVGNVMYASAPGGFVHAVDARTGKRLWMFDPQVDGAILRKVCCDMVNRGLAVAQDRVFVASVDGRLFSIDVKTGKEVWQVDTFVDHSRGYTITGAVYIAGDVAIIGNSGADLDARGYISAYNIADGKLRWRFFTVPANTTGPFENPELKAAARTWDAQSRFDVGGGGTVWDGMAYDPKLGLIYVGTGNAALYPRKLRSPAGGDNLYLSSILALHAKTGKLAWYYQTTPGDQWDFTSTQKMILADLPIGGHVRHVLMQAPKNGFFYMLDRGTGELLSAEPYVQVTWATHVDRASGRVVQSLQGDYSNEPRLVFPSFVGGHNWQPMALNPHTGLVYIPAIEASIVLWMPQRPFVYERSGNNMGLLWAWPIVQGGEWGWGLDSHDTIGLPPWSELRRGQPDPTIRGFLRAWDPVANRIVWQVETSDDWVGQINAMWNGGGVMTTAGGLVFQGRSTGYLYAYRADNGVQLATINVGTSIMAAPMTYEIGGVQYVAVMAGFGGSLGSGYPQGTAAYRYGNAGKIVAFKLGGNAVPLPQEVRRTEGFQRPAIARFGSQKLMERGSVLFDHHCSGCHWNKATAGMVPDLRRMSAETHAQFEDIVLKGIRSAKGMGSFAQLLEPEDVNAIHSAIVDWSWKEYAKENPAEGSR